MLVDVGCARLGSLVAVIAALTLAACGGDPGPGDPRDGGARDGGDPGIDGGPGVDGGPGSDGGEPADGAIGGDAGVDGGGPISMPCTATGACDPFDPTSCGAQACRRGSMGTECMNVDAEPRAVGEVCERAEQCAAGSICLSYPSDGFRCRRMCPDGSVGFCGEGSACTGTIAGELCVQICRPLPPACDIYAQDCADPAHTCTFATDPEREVPYTGCRPAGPRSAGESCGGEAGTCGHDLVCIRIDTATQCRQPCDPDAAVDECPTGQVCTGFARTWMVGYCVDAT